MAIFRIFSDLRQQLSRGWKVSARQWSNGWIPGGLFPHIYSVETPRNSAQIFCVTWQPTTNITTRQPGSGLTEAWSRTFRHKKCSQLCFLSEELQQSPASLCQDKERAAGGMICLKMILISLGHQCGDFMAEIRPPLLLKVLSDHIAETLYPTQSCYWEQDILWVLGHSTIEHELCSPPPPLLSPFSLGPGSRRSSGHHYHEFFSNFVKFESPTLKLPS